MSCPMAKNRSLDSGEFMLIGNFRIHLYTDECVNIFIDTGRPASGAQVDHQIR